MKKKSFSVLSTSITVLMSAFLISAAPQKEETLTKEDGTYIVNTTTLGKDVMGYEGSTPLKIYIKKNKVVKIEALKNHETPKYFAKIKKELLNKWDGMKVNDALKQEVDGVTGATFSSDAVKKNVQLGLEYYKKHK